MVDILRPNYGQVWASEGEKVSPVEDKVKLGWVQEMMPFQWENFLQARQDEAITYLLQKGVPEYSPTQEYIANKSTVIYQGILYTASQTVTGVLPTVETSWKRVGPAVGANGAVSIGAGGTGATTLTGAKENLGIGTLGGLNLVGSTGILVKTGVLDVESRTLTGTSGNIVVTNPDGVAGNPVINVGTNVVRTNADPSWTTTRGIRLPSGSTGDRGTSVSGTIRYNTELNKFEGYNGTSWDSLGASLEVTPTTLSGDGVTTTFSLLTAPVSPNTLCVTIGGIVQGVGTYSVNGAQIVFSEAPTAGVDNIQVISLKSVAIGQTTANQVYVEDVGNYFTSTTVEGALSELGKTSSTVFQNVPTTFTAQVITVTQPHLRCMVWNGTKYVRAPWHQPGVYFYAHDPLGKITHGIQVRTDVTYSTADHPDLAEYLGVVGPTFVLPGDGRARVLRAADNGMGIDTALVNGYLQADAVGAWSATVNFHGSGTATTVSSGSGTGFIPLTQRNAYRPGGEDLTNATSMDGFTIGTPAGMSAAETRVKSLIATLYITK